MVHDESVSPRAYAHALASLHRPDFPLPIGVIRAVEDDCYEEDLERQVEQATGRGDNDVEAIADLVDLRFLADPAENCGRFEAY